MGPVDAATIRILVTADGAGVARGLGTASTAVASFERAATQSFRRVTTAFNSLSTTQRVLGAVGIGLGVLAVGMAAVVGPAIEFESAFAGVRKTVDGTPAQLNSIRTGLLDLSGVMPTTAAELASIAENAGQLGVAAPDVLEFTKVIAQLGETTDLDFDQAAQSLARFLNITGNDTSITQIADVIVELGNNSATTESQIVNFSTRLASAFTVAGATEEQILGVASAFSSLGLQAEAGGSSLSRIITSISDAALEGGEDLRIYSEVAGILPEQFAAIAKENPVEAFLLFSEGLARVKEGGEAITPILEDLALGGLRTSEVFRLAALNFALIRDQLELSSDAFNNGGAAQEEYAKRVETTAARLDILQNRLTTVAITLGTPLLGSLAEGADLAGDAIVALVEALRPLASEIGGLFSNAGELAGQFFSIIDSGGIDESTSALDSLVNVLTTLLAAFNSLGPAGLILAALVADIVLVGPVSIAAAAGLNAVALAGGGVAGAMTAASAGINRLLLGINPLAAAAGVLAIAFFQISRETAGFEEAANRVATALETRLQGALQDQDMVTFGTSVRGARQEIAGLQQQLDNVDGFGKFNQVLNDFSFGLFAGNEQIQEAQIRIEALNEVLESDQVVAYESNMARLTQQFGLSESSILAAAEAAGVLDALWGTSVEAIQAQVIAIEAYRKGLDELEGVQRETADAVLSGTASFEQYAEAVGLSTDNFIRFLQTSDDVDYEDFFQEEAALNATAFAIAQAAVTAELKPLADALGITTDELQSQIVAVEDLVRANSDLREAIDGSRSAQEAYAAQQRNVAEAQTAFNDSLEDLSLETLPEAVARYRELNEEVAGSGVSYAEAEERILSNQRVLLDHAEAAGIDRDAVFDLVTEFGTIPDEILVAIVTEGLELEEAVERYRESLEETAGEYRARLEAEDRASEVVDPLLEKVAEWFGVRNMDFSATDDATPTVTPLLAAAAEWFGIKTATFRAEDGTNGLLESLLPGVREWLGVKTATLRAEDESEGTVAEATGRLAFWSAGFTAPLTVDDQSEAPVTTAQQRLIAYSLAEYRAQIQANGTPAEEVIQTVLGSLGRVEDRETIPTIDANPGPFDGKIATVESDLDGVDTTTAIPAVDADLARFKRGIGEVLAGVTLLNNTTATPTITANTSVARARLIGIVNLISSIRSKSVTITTYHRQVQTNSGGSINPQGPSRPRPTYDPYTSGAVLADGGIIDPPVVLHNADVSRAKLERPGLAQIYQPVTPGRFFAEPVTGGEAYIPLAPGKRNQSIPIWEMTGRLLGVLENGGIQHEDFARFNNGGISGAIAPRPGGPAVQSSIGDINIAMPIQVDIRATAGQDPEAIAQQVAIQIDRSANRMRRQLENSRRR